MSDAARYKETRESVARSRSLEPDDATESSRELDAGAGHSIVQPDMSEEVPPITDHQQETSSSLTDGILSDEILDDTLPHLDDGALSRFDEAVRAGDAPGAAAVVRTHWFELTRNLRSGVMESIETLPPPALNAQPLLLVLLGLTHYVVPQSRAKGFRYFSAAIEAARAASDTLDPIDRAVLFTIEAAAFRLVGNPAAGREAAASALRALDRLSEEQRRSLPAITSMYSHIGITQYSAGHSDEALSTFELGMAEIRRADRPPGLMNVSMIAGIHALNGDVTEAAAYIDLVRSGRWSPQQKSGYGGTFYRLAEAITALEQLDSAAARARLASMIHDRRTIEFWTEIAITEALCELVEHRPGAALAGIDAFASIRGSEGRHSRSQAALAPTRALLQLALGNLTSAAQQLRVRTPRSALREIGLARLELFSGQPGAALEATRRAAAYPQNARATLEAASIRAAALLRLRNGRHTNVAVDHLAEIAIRTGQRLGIALIPQEDYERLLGALARRSHGSLLARLPVSSLLTVPTPPAVLTDRELAVLQALARRTPLPELAADLFLTVNTVKTHRRNLYRKLGATSRDEAIAIAIDRHLVPGPSAVSKSETR